MLDDLLQQRLQGRARLQFPLFGLLADPAAIRFALGVSPLATTLCVIEQTFGIVLRYRCDPFVLCLDLSPKAVFALALLPLPPGGFSIKGCLALRDAAGEIASLRPDLFGGSLCLRQEHPSLRSRLFDDRGRTLLSELNDLRVGRYASVFGPKRFVFGPKRFVFGPQRFVFGPQRFVFGPKLFTEST
ncbi:hypothetical protein BJ970_004644 [Saccharopolyspora phatthalungensis]|uniref:Uncharacterized protein n=1 Tax=Saccharopolyspora phatthalungensis TaxID=664693 RepID=A0A840QBC8_9PSEU|nr:hypothetical protein [Saccharopolyspora phatthalungensis]